jgi:hypothetical protein
VKYLTLDFHNTAEGIVVSAKHLGQVATIVRDTLHGTNIDARGVPGWLVKAYAFPQWERNRIFESLNAAEHYAMALAYEMSEGSDYAETHRRISNMRAAEAQMTGEDE